MGNTNDQPGRLAGDHPISNPERRNRTLNAAWGRGWNAGIRHALELLAVERGLSELAHAPVIRTVAWPFFDLEIETGGES